MRKRKPAPGRTKSNTWALVAAVLVATFSLVFNHWFPITPDKIEAMKGSLASLEEVSRDWVASVGGPENEVPADELPATPEAIKKDLDQLKPIAEAYFSAHVRSVDGLEEKVDQAAGVMRRVHGEILALPEETPAEELTALKMAELECLFLLAGMRPDEFGETFDNLAVELTSGDHGKTEPILLLRAYHGLRLHSDSEEVVLEKLRRYSASASNDAFAIKLYTLIAQGMKKCQRELLAGQILRLGMQRYTGHPERSRLVNALIDLKIEKLAH